jgi:lysophospholipase L1-like esterase
LPRAASRPSTNLILLFGSVVISAAFLEVVARFLLPAPLPWRYPQQRYRADPALVFALRPSQQAFSADKPVAINARGLRGPVIPYERTPGVERLLFLGDSIVFGHGVVDADVVTERVVSRLREAGTRAEAINTGVPSYNTEQEIAYLGREGVRYHPDWVIVGVCWNDISEKSAVQVSPDGWLVSPGIDTSKPMPRLSESPFGYALRNTLKRSRLLYASLEGWRAVLGMIRPDKLVQFRSDVLEGRDTPAVADGWVRVEAALHRLHELSRQQGFRPLVVAFPLPLALERPFPQSSYPARLQAIGEREGIPVIDLEPTFRGAFRGHESLFIPFDSDHPNAAGHDLAAREIVHFVTSEVAREDRDNTL